ncbi:protein kinase domain-containing protein [Nocardioides ultimimeridianus]
MVLAEGSGVDLGPLGYAWVTRLLGQGGQGYVFEVQRQSGEPLALKWYKPESATPEQYDEMQQLVEIGSPHRRFLWPLSMARVGGQPSFGYVMNLRNQRYLELSYLLLNADRDGRPLDVSFAAIIELCRQLSFSFLRLHARGLCYRDISFGNVFFEPSTGDVLVCDVDNVGIDNGSSRVLGTPYFMAPEVVRDLTYQTLPNTDTDRHSLAVLLFYALFLGHPLEGARTDAGMRDAQWLMTHFGTDPLFCLHPERTENAPAEIVQRYWRIYPQFVRDLFVQAFVDGLDRPAVRVTEGQWIRALDRLRDGMLPCPACGTTNFWTPGPDPVACWQCDAPLAPAYVMEIGRRVVAVGDRTTLRADHLTSGVDNPVIIGEVLRHPQAPDRWGLHNTSDFSWPVAYPGGQSFLLQPGSTLELVEGTRLQLRDAVLSVRRGPA